jgi:hypothetical protein
VVAEKGKTTTSNKEGSVFSLEKREKESQSIGGKIVQSPFRENQEEDDWFWIQIYGRETCERDE